jgi:hypothetical protein
VGAFVVVLFDVEFFAVAFDALRIVASLSSAETVPVPVDAVLPVDERPVAVPSPVTPVDASELVGSVVAVVDKPSPDKPVDAVQSDVADTGFADAEVVHADAIPALARNTAPATATPMRMRLVLKRPLLPEEVVYIMIRAYG